MMTLKQPCRTALPPMISVAAAARRLGGRPAWQCKGRADVIACPRHADLHQRKSSTSLNTQFASAWLYALAGAGARGGIGMVLIRRCWCWPAALLRLHSTSPVVQPTRPTTARTIPAAARAGWLTGERTSAATAPWGAPGMEPAAVMVSSWPACCTPPTSGCASDVLSATAASVSLLLAVALLLGMGGGRAANEPPTPGLGRAGREKSGCQSPSRAYVLALSLPCCLQRCIPGKDRRGPSDDDSRRSRSLASMPCVTMQRCGLCNNSTVGTHPASSLVRTRRCAGQLGPPVAPAAPEPRSCLHGEWVIETWQLMGQR